ncbi:uncharacterized protein FOMMEDRAFT_106598 [Fomitiporia mediterranea MF3/22]|uniref:uncharacterized protein n=1 Tax=Fomitiporia mediterranea (strain MF3/22) TaxID=694068 RepID=UPI0004408EF6|nr:uncharacterized protein FOMMEDRAFT_106598 [Fomitiporia mediterranea MF3/22]EJD04120.1 hypothetical protein FOMMEDRAFT_106598 [Fomitiporia mediterranea MF3/22]
MPGTQEARVAAGGSSTLDGKCATIIFILMLLGFVAESQLTEYVESSRNYRQPYFLFYIAHSAMTLIFPLHLLYLRCTTPFPVKSYLLGLSKSFKENFTTAFSPAASELGHNGILDFPIHRLLAVITWCTVGITTPALLWFVALNYASVSDVTAIWNSNAFWAYVMSVKLKHTSWEPRRLAAVVIASIGVMVVIYGGNHPTGSSDSEDIKAPFFGNMLALAASVTYALYQVLYNMYAVPPSEAEDEDRGAWRRLSVSSDSVDEALVNDDDIEGLNLADDVVYPLPFGLYTNALTSGIGIMTLIALWIPMPILHLTSIEPFVWPSDTKTLLAICGIGVSALTFLATFMIMLATWGPIVTSVGGLLTTVLVIISDLIFGNAASTLTLWTVIGAGMIVFAFAALAYESLNAHKAGS